MHKRVENYPDRRPIFGAPEPRAAAKARTNDQELADGERAARIQADIANHVRGAPAQLARLLVEVGRNDRSAFSELTTRDQVRDSAFEPMHTFARCVGRILGAITRGQALTASLSKVDAMERLPDQPVPRRRSPPDQYIEVVSHGDDDVTGTVPCTKSDGEHETWTDARRFQADTLRAGG